MALSISSQESSSLLYQEQPTRTTNCLLPHPYHQYVVIDTLLQENIDGMQFLISKLVTMSLVESNVHFTIHEKKWYISTHVIPKLVAQLVKELQKEDQAQRKDTLKQVLVLAQGQPVLEEQLPFFCESLSSIVCSTLCSSRERQQAGQVLIQLSKRLNVLHAAYGSLEKGLVTISKNNYDPVLAQQAQEQLTASPVEKKSISSLRAAPILHTLLPNKASSVSTSLENFNMSNVPQQEYQRMAQQGENAQMLKKVQQLPNRSVDAIKMLNDLLKSELFHAACPELIKRSNDYLSFVFDNKTTCPDEFDDEFIQALCVALMTMRAQGNSRFISEREFAARALIGIAQQKNLSLATQQTVCVCLSGVADQTYYSRETNKSKEARDIMLSIMKNYPVHLMSQEMVQALAYVLTSEAGINFVLTLAKEQEFPPALYHQLAPIIWKLYEIDRSSMALSSQKLFDVTNAVMEYIIDHSQSSLISPTEIVQYGKTLSLLVLHEPTPQLGKKAASLLTELINPLLLPSKSMENLCDVWYPLVSTSPNSFSFGSSNSSLLSMMNKKLSMRLFQLVCSIFQKPIASNNFISVCTLLQKISVEQSSMNLEMSEMKKLAFQQLCHILGHNSISDDVYQKLYGAVKDKELRMLQALLIGQSFLEAEDLPQHVASLLGLDEDQTNSLQKGIDSMFRQ